MSYFFHIIKQHNNAHQRADDVISRLAQPSSGRTGLGFRPLDARVSAPFIIQPQKNVKPIFIIFYFYPSTKARVGVRGWWAGVP
jgi:hypothetical protein